MTTKTTTSSLPQHIRDNFVQDVDGYYYYWPGKTDREGHYAAHHLREIAEALDEINKPWDDEIKEVIGAE
jgi:uncharacterized protein (DUF2164 family)